MTPTPRHIPAHLIAPISLLVAGTAFGHTAWRQERIQDPPTLRVAAFHSLQTTGAWHKARDLWGAVRGLRVSGQ